MHLRKSEKCHQTLASKRKVCLQLLLAGTIHCLSLPYLYFYLGVGLTHHFTSSLPSLKVACKDIPVSSHLCDLQEDRVSSHQPGGPMFSACPRDRERVCTPILPALWDLSKLLNDHI